MLFLLFLLDQMKGVAFFSSIIKNYDERRPYKRLFAHRKQFN